MREAVAKRDLRDLVADAAGVLRACGYEPADYQAELGTQDPISLAGSGRTAEVTVVFEPLDGARRHALIVSSAEPCVVAWSWQPDRFTDWQRRVLERAEEQIIRSRSAREDGGQVELRITETRDHVAVRWWFGEALDTGSILVLAKDGLEPVEVPRAGAKDSHEDDSSN